MPVDLPAAVESCCIPLNLIEIYLFLHWIVVQDNLIWKIQLTFHGNASRENSRVTSAWVWTCVWVCEMSFHTKGCRVVHWPTCFFSMCVGTYWPLALAWKGLSFANWGSGVHVTSKKNWIWDFVSSLEHSHQGIYSFQVYWVAFFHIIFSFRKRRLRDRQATNPHRRWFRVPRHQKQRRNQVFKLQLQVGFFSLFLAVALVCVGSSKFGVFCPLAERNVQFCMATDLAVKTTKPVKIAPKQFEWEAVVPFMFLNELIRVDFHCRVGHNQPHENGSCDRWAPGWLCSLCYGGSSTARLPQVKSCFPQHTPQLKNVLRK